jgi:hypothetical protein
VTAAFAGFFYAESPDRAAGIKVVSSSAVSIGNGVQVSGWIASSDGEKYVQATSVTRTGSNNIVKPLGMTGRAAFGTGGGLSGVGLLATVWGKVTSVSSDRTYCCVDDGSGIGTGGARVLLNPRPTLGLVGKRVRATGVLCAAPGGTRALRAAEEPFEDLNFNGWWNPGESFTDANGSGAYDGVAVYDAPPVQLGVSFDSKGTALVHGTPFFPIGIYLYDFAPATQTEVLAKGFNTVICAVTPADLPFLQAHGLMTLPYPTSEWTAMKDHPSILAWYLYDEPEGWGITPAQAHAEYLRVKGLDPNHPAGMCHYLWDALWNYRDSEDFVLSDVYPIHRTSITAVADHIWRIHQIHGDNYPAWPVMQAFGGTEGWDVPTPVEERLMVYMSLVHGAKAIMFFSFRPQHVDLWAEVGVLVQELKQLTPFYVLPSSGLPVSYSNSALRARCIQIGDSGLVMVTNTGYLSFNDTITVTGLPVTSLSLPLEGGGTIPVVNSRFTASFGPLGVHVYQWGPTPGL